ncbi:terminase small subunit [Sulfitobacter aestuarii]|uniref:Terminase small subunit n=1 Tax=Sulfitobacter aestuarii TaxID=2161676 RepID=A0ABW5U9S7_9RHOB
MTMQPRELAVSDVPLWALRYKLTLQQAYFVDAYLEDFDAVKAFRAAGFAGRDAQGLATKLLCQRKIQAALKHRHEDLRCRAEELKASLLAWMNAVLRADLRDLFDAEQVKPVSEWPLIWRTGAVGSVTVRRSRDGKRGIGFQLDMTNRFKILKLMTRHIGMSGARIKRNEDRKILAHARAAQRRADRMPPRAF